MHELSLCQSAVEIIQRQAEQHDVKRVTAVWLEVARSPALRRAPSVLVLKLSATERWRKGAIYISSINPPGTVLGLQRWWRFISTMRSVRSVMASGCVSIPAIR